MCFLVRSKIPPPSLLYQKKRSTDFSLKKPLPKTQDTEVLYTVATQQVADRFGKTFTWDLKVRQMGLASLDYASLIVSEMELPLTAQQYLDEVADIHANLFPTTILMPGQKTPSHIF